MSGLEILDSAPAGRSKKEARVYQMSSIHRECAISFKYLPHLIFQKEAFFLTYGEIEARKVESYIVGE